MSDFQTPEYVSGSVKLVADRQRMMDFPSWMRMHSASAAQALD
jgi:hypothetical protein